MTDDELALLRTIREYPDADLPRLVYADWLEEHGDADRAEFIRLQIERHARAAGDPAARGIGPREYQLLLAHEREWKDELPPGFRDGAAFRRGLIHRVRCRVFDLFDPSHRAVFAPVEELHVTIDALNTAWMLDAPPLLTELPLRELALDCTVPVGALLADVLVRFGPYPRLHTLRIRDAAFGAAGVLALAPLPAFPAVRHLDLTGCGIAPGPGEAAPDVFAHVGWTDRLDRLTLGTEVRLR